MIRDYVVTMNAWDDNHTFAFHDTLPDATFVHPQADGHTAAVSVVPCRNPRGTARPRRQGAADQPEAEVLAARHAPRNAEAHEELPFQSSPVRILAPPSHYDRRFRP